ncbi:MAG: nuclear transport factor 2 family protein [Deltaproteobacteria bacterium]|nr:nuclear transport factor 2 family protein [Deltaproteobacteria bacterium]
MTKNIETVKAIYAAFGRKDVPAILEHVSDDCDWEYAYRADHEVPWLARRRGREGAAAFFAAVSALDFTHFEVKAILGEGDLVVALCDLTCTVRATGRGFTEIDEPHLWHFDARGRVRRFRHAADTLAQKSALL